MYSIPAGASDTHWDWNVNVPGNVVAMIGHVHKYGVSVEATNESGAASHSASRRRRAAALWLVSAATAVISSNAATAPTSPWLPPTAQRDPGRLTIGRPVWGLTGGGTIARGRADDRVPRFGTPCPDARSRCAFDGRGHLQSRACCPRVGGRAGRVGDRRHPGPARARAAAARARRRALMTDPVTEIANVLDALC